MSFFDPPWRLDELAGELTVEVSDSHGDYWHRPRGPVALVEQDLGVARYAAWVPVGRAVLEDAPSIRALIDRGIDRALRPWRYPDEPAWPSFVVVPSLVTWAGRVAEGRRRLRSAWSVVRWGVPDEVEDL